MTADKIREPSKRKDARSDDADALLNEALQMTFPASDPIAISFDRRRTTEQRQTATGRKQRSRSGRRSEGD